MGVKDLWKVLEPVKQQVPCSDLKGQTLAVDLSLWVCEAEGVSEMRGRVVKPYLRNLFFRVSHLTQAGVHLVFVIDGEAPDLKIEEMVRRQQIRFPGKNFGRGKASAKTASRSHFKALLRECCEMLDYMGIPYIQSVGEAEALAALLNKERLVDGVITNDGDAFLYGARKVCRNFSMNKQESHVEMYRMRHIERDLGLDREKLVALGLFLGCDYAPKGVPGVGYNTALKYLAELRECGVIDRLCDWPSGRFTPLCQVEEQIRRKALTLPVFPNFKVVNEFMVPKDKIPRKHTIVAKRPKMFTTQKFLMQKLEWELEYAFEKILPLVTFYDLNSIKAGVENRKSLIPHRIVKSCVRHFVPLYKIEWYKEERDDISTGEFYTTLEDQALFETCYPELVKEFTAELDKKGKKPKKAKENTKEITEDVAVVSRMESLSLKVEEPEKSKSDVPAGNLPRKSVKAKTSSESNPYLSVKKLPETKPEVGKPVCSVKKKIGLEAVLGEIQNLPRDKCKEVVTMAKNGDLSDASQGETEEEEMLPLSQRLIKRVKESVTSNGSKSSSSEVVAATETKVVEDKTRKSGSKSEAVFVVSGDSEDELLKHDEVFVETQSKSVQKGSIQRLPTKKQGSCILFSSSDEDEPISGSKPRKLTVKFNDSTEFSLLPTGKSGRKEPAKVTKFSFDDSSDISLLEPSLAHRISRMSISEENLTQELKTTNDPESSLDKKDDGGCSEPEANFSLGLTFNCSHHDDEEKANESFEDDKVRANKPLVDDQKETAGILGCKSSSRSDSIEKCRETALDVSCTSLDCSAFLPLDMTLTAKLKEDRESQSSEDSPQRSMPPGQCDETLLVQRKTELLPDIERESKNVVKNSQDICVGFSHKEPADDIDVTIAIDKYAMVHPCVQTTDSSEGDLTLVVQSRTDIIVQRDTTTVPVETEMDCTVNMNSTIALTRHNSQTGLNDNDPHKPSDDVTLVFTNIIKTDSELGNKHACETELSENIDDLDKTLTRPNPVQNGQSNDTTILVSNTWTKERLEETIRVEKLHFVDEMASACLTEAGSCIDGTTLVTDNITGKDTHLSSVDETMILDKPIKPTPSTDETILVRRPSKDEDSAEETIAIIGHMQRIASADETILVSESCKGMVSGDKTIAIGGNLGNVSGETAAMSKVFMHEMDKEDYTSIDACGTLDSGKNDTIVVNAENVCYFYDSRKDRKTQEDVSLALNEDTLLVHQPLSTDELPKSMPTEFHLNAEETICFNTENHSVAKDSEVDSRSIACKDDFNPDLDNGCDLDLTLNNDLLSESIISFAPGLRSSGQQRVNSKLTNAGKTDTECVITLSMEKNEGKSTGENLHSLVTEVMNSSESSEDHDDTLVESSCKLSMDNNSNHILKSSDVDVRSKTGKKDSGYNTEFISIEISAKVLEMTEKVSNIHQKVRDKNNLSEAPVQQNRDCVETDAKTPVTVKASDLQQEKIIATDGNTSETPVNHKKQLMASKASAPKQVKSSKTLNDEKNTAVDAKTKKDATSKGTETRYKLSAKEGPTDGKENKRTKTDQNNTSIIDLTGNTPIARRTRGRNLPPKKTLPKEAVAAVTKTTGRIKTGHKPKDEIDVDGIIVLNASNSMTRSKVKNSDPVQLKLHSGGQTGKCTGISSRSRCCKEPQKENKPESSQKVGALTNGKRVRSRDNGVNDKVSKKINDTGAAKPCTRWDLRSRQVNKFEASETSATNGSTRKINRVTEARKTRRPEAAQTEVIVVTDSPVQRRTTRSSRQRVQARTKAVGEVIVID